MAKRRKPGEGSLSKRKDGRWEARVVVSYDEKGMPKTQNVTTVSKAKCLEKLEKLKAELGTVTKKTTPTMSFGEWMDLWYQTYCKNTLKESTQATYEQRIYKQIIPKLGHIPLNQLNAGTLEKFYAQLKSNGRLVRRDIYGPGLANSVIRSIHAHCRAALDKAVAEKLIRQNPAIGCKLPSKKSAEIKILTPEAMQKLLFQAQIEGFYEMFMLDLATGLRRGEIVGLQWKDIDFEAGTLSITKQIRYVKGKLVIAPPKTKASERTIILPPPILEMLAEYRKTVDYSIWLFPSPVKKEDVPRDPSACRKALARILKRAECEHVPFHAMRHTFASNAFHYGMDVKTLASAIGHESVDTTLNVYAHSSEQMKRDAAKKIEEAIGTVLGADVTASDASYDDENSEAQEPTNDTDKPKTVELGHTSPNIANAEQALSTRSARMCGKGDIPRRSTVSALHETSMLIARKSAR